MSGLYLFGSIVAGQERAPPPEASLIERRKRKKKTFSLLYSLKSFGLWKEKEFAYEFIDSSLL